MRYIFRLQSHSLFQSTPPRRRRPRLYEQRCVFNLYFNPRLREGGDTYTFCGIYPAYYISIHASAKEATNITPHYFHFPL